MRDMSAKIEKAWAVREGGDVKRLHVVPVHTDPSVARHSWNMAALLWLLHPNPSKNLLLSCILHDCNERWVGDTPAPVKYSMFPDLGREIKKAEEVVDEIMGFAPHLNEHEKNWRRGVDLLELLMYAQAEIAMGNRNMQATHDNVRAHIVESSWVPEPIVDFARQLRWQRTMDVVMQGETFGALEDNS